MCVSEDAVIFRGPDAGRREPAANVLAGHRQDRRGGPATGCPVDSALGIPCSAIRAAPQPDARKPEEMRRYERPVRAESFISGAPRRGEGERAVSRGPLGHRVVHIADFPPVSPVRVARGGQARFAGLAADPVSPAPLAGEAMESVSPSPLAKGRLHGPGQAPPRPRLRGRLGCPVRSRGRGPRRRAAPLTLSPAAPGGGPTAPQGQRNRIGSLIRGNSNCNGAHAGADLWAKFFKKVLDACLQG